jgi:hypothetical protein
VAVQAAIAAQVAAAATAGRPFIAPTAAGSLPQVNHLLAGATTIMMIPGVGLVMHAPAPAGMTLAIGETTADAEVTAVAQSTTLMDPMAIAHAAAAAAYHQQQMQLQMALKRQAKALEKEAKATKRAAERAERDQANSAKKVEKEEKKAKREAERAIKAELMKMPRKPHSSYLYFCDETREALRAAHPDTSVPDLAKLQGAAWKALDESEKQVYMDKAAEDLERYKAEMEAGNWYEREKELKRQEEERRIAAGEEPPSKARAEPAARTRARRRRRRRRGCIQRTNERL